MALSNVSQKSNVAHSQTMRRPERQVAFALLNDEKVWFRFRFIHIVTIDPISYEPCRSVREDSFVELNDGRFGQTSEICVSFEVRWTDACKWRHLPTAAPLRCPSFPHITTDVPTQAPLLGTFTTELH